MKPIDIDDNYLVIDASMDDSIFPEGIYHSSNIYNHSNNHHYFDDSYSSFPEIDIDEYRDHI